MMESEQDKEARKTEFAVFGIENLAERLRMSGRDIVAELNKTDGIELTPILERREDYDRLSRLY